MAREAGLAGAVVHTDGACIRNPGKGGWAWAASHELYASGFDPATTNQRMELTATIEAMTALQALTTPLVVVSDSTYVVNCWRQHWWVSWQRRGWRNSKGELVANQDLWRAWIELITGPWRQRISFEWVKGHAGNEMNEFVDRLANGAARGQVAQAGPAPLPDAIATAADWAEGRLFP
jgi:ribonuclease HI